MDVARQEDTITTRVHEQRVESFSATIIRRNILNIRRALHDLVAQLNTCDVALFVFTGIVAVVISSLLSGEILPALYERDAFDVWFEGDLPRIYENSTSRYSYSRSRYHPVFSLLLLLPAKVLVKGVGVEPLTAVRALLACACALWTAGLFALLRALGCRRLDAVVFTGVALSSASVIFFFSVLEAFLIGSITIILALWWATVHERGGGSRFVEALISASTLGISTSNWMVGVLGTFYRRRLSDAMQITLNALVFVVLLWTLQKNVIPDSEFFLGVDYGPERVQMFSTESGGLYHVFASFFAHSMVMPEIRVVDRVTASSWWPSLLVQKSPVASAGIWGIPALLAWLMLLLFGLVATVTLKKKPRVRLLLASVLLGQLVLHVAFGNETFLYAIHWVPLLVAVSALSTMTRFRIIALAGATVFIVAGGVNNLHQFFSTSGFLVEHAPAVMQRREVERKSRSPGYPRPGEANEIRQCATSHFRYAAYDAWGSLWPARNTFNVALWIYDASGDVLAARHETETPKIDLSEAVEPGTETVLSVKTRYYLARWECSGPRQWRLTLHVFAEPLVNVDLVLRGIGWKFSRLFSIKSEADGLLLNSRWRLTTDPRVETIRLGEEGSPDWWRPPRGVTEVKSAAGLAFARIGPLAPGRYDITIVDEAQGSSIDTFRETISYAAKNR